MPERGSVEEFLAFSREYSEALEALETIERKSGAIAGMGGGEDLRALVERFVAMARAAAERAAAAGLMEIAGWFGELIDRAEAAMRRLEV